MIRKKKNDIMEETNRLLFPAWARFDVYFISSGVKQRGADAY